MRMQSVYVVSCDRCYSEIESVSTTATCPKCGRVIRLEWGKPVTMEPKK